MLEIFVEVVSPVFLMAGIGALIRRFRNVPSDSISQITLYIFAPALVFNSLAGTDIPLEEMGKIALFAVCLAAAMYLLSIAVARVLALGREGSQRLSPDHPLYERGQLRPSGSPAGLRRRRS